MNHLAHALIALPEPGHVQGGLLGDFWRGSVPAHWPDGLRHGVILHRRVDVYTDAHPEVRACLALFEPSQRRLLRVVLDVWFDHLLARDWERHASQPLPTFSRMCLDLMQAAPPEFEGTRVAGFVRYARGSGLFEGYSDLQRIRRVVLGMEQRFSRPVRLLPTLDLLAGHETTVRSLQGS